MKNGINNIKESFSPGSFEEEVDFETQMLALAFLSAIEEEASSQDVKRKELAAMIGTSPSYITQILRGNKIPNLRILVALGLALEKKFNVETVSDIYKSRSPFDDCVSGKKFDSHKVGKRMHICHSNKDMLNKDDMLLPTFCKKTS